MPPDNKEKPANNHADPHSEFEPSAGPHLPESDIRAMIGLLAEISAITGNREARRRALVDGLANLIGADSWIWSMLGEYDASPRAGHPHTVFLKGGLDDRQLGFYLKSQEHPDMGRLTAGLLAEFQERKQHLTRSQPQIVSDEEYRSLGVTQLLDEADIGTAMLSLRPTSSGQVGVIGLFRKVGSPHFGERETRIAHILISEVGWLHDDSWPNHPRHEISELTPRLRSVLTLLLHGEARKAIADKLGLSIHTVGDYIKQVYRHFSVHSQSELIRRFVSGDGGDVASRIDGP